MRRDNRLDVDSFNVELKVSLKAYPELRLPPDLQTKGAMILDSGNISIYAGRLERWGVLNPERKNGCRSIGFWKNECRKLLFVNACPVC